MKQRKTVTFKRMSPVSRGLLNRFASAAKEWGAALAADSQREEHSATCARYNLTHAQLAGRIERLETAAAKQPEPKLWVVTIRWPALKKRRYQNADRYVVMAPSEEAANALVRIRIQEEYKVVPRHDRGVHNIFEQQCEPVTGPIAYKDFPSFRVQRPGKPAEQYHQPDEN